MAADSSVHFASETTAGQRRVLDDARRRLIALAGDLQPDTSEAALLATAAALDTVVHRIRWVADLSRHEEES